MKFSLTVLFLFAFGISHANYSTPGMGKVWDLDSMVTYSSGNVTYTAGEYYVNDTIIISASDTVKVTTNAVIKFGTSVFIDIFGVLIVNPPDSAKITAQDTSLKFLGLKFEDQSDGSFLKKLIFEYGNSIRMLDCNILIDSCTIRFNNLNSSFASGAISLFRSNSVITNCKIYRNRRAAIVSGANIASSPVIENNIIFENDTDNTNVPQINFGATASTPMIIRGNQIIGGMYNMSGGISFFPAGSIPKVIIENNIIKKNRYGIAIAGGNSNFYINNNIIDSNNIQGLPLSGGSGINFNGNSTQISVVTRNKIRGNLWGITIQGTAKPNLGDLFSSDTSDAGLNEIYWNGNSGKIFDLFNNTIDSIKAMNNYWGSAIIDSVESHIFHKPDSAVLGQVRYLPLQSLKLNLKLLTEGLYNNSIDLLARKDTMKVYLRNADAPYSIVDSAISTIDTVTFTGLFEFFNAFSGQYYIQVKHFNSLETWSKSGGETLSLNVSINNFDFTNSSGQAYGGNMILEGSRYCFYSGDIDQNGIIDASDSGPTDNDASNFASGIRLLTDLDGNNIVDANDMAILDNNTANFVQVISPLVK
ncbi:MAG: hypothetical protein HGGPFJEG_02053 [Ignavibacteria bacterium]|nr:hypothetical protein [Ignavibacteria bacterium]